MVKSRPRGLKRNLRPKRRRENYLILGGYGRNYLRHISFLRKAGGHAGIWRWKGTGALAVGAEMTANCWKRAFAEKGKKTRNQRGRVRPRLNHVSYMWDRNVKGKRGAKKAVPT